MYAGFSASKLNAANTNWFYGPTLGIYDDLLHLPLVNFGVDARGMILGSGGSIQVSSGLAGPRAVAHLPIVPLHPYVEGLAGAGHVQLGQGVSQTSGTYFAYSVVGGLDLNFFPRLDWRIAEFSYSGFPNLLGGTNQKSLTTGLVFRLPIP